MSTIFIPTKPLVKTIRQETIQLVQKTHQPPSLAVIQGNETPPTLSYLRIKEKVANELGITWHLYKPRDAEDVQTTLRWLMSDQEVTGVLVQLPIEKKLGELNAILKDLHPNKDVENLTGHAKVSPTFAKALVLGLRFLQTERVNHSVPTFETENIWFATSSALTRAIQSTLTLENIKWKPADSIQTATAIITATGKPGSIRDIELADGTIVIDGGIEKTTDEKWAGDFEATDQAEKTILATPVPGGIGPVTVEVLFNSLATLAQTQY